MDRENFETLIKFYESARQEMLARLSARDNTLLLYIGAVGAIIAASFEKDVKYFCMIIPFLAFGTSLIMSHHHSAIRTLGIYCSIDLTETFRQNGITVPSFELARFKRKYPHRNALVRYAGDTVLIIIPTLVSLLMVAADVQLRDEYLIIFWLGWICFLGSSFIMITAMFRSVTFNRQVRKYAFEDERELEKISQPDL
jgi:hypothetical protein